MTLAIGVDIGGTKVAAGVVDADGNVLTRARRRTPSHDPEHIVDVVVEIVRQLRTEHDAGPVGIGAAGYIDVERAHVMFAPNLPGWRNTPLREQVSERLGSDVVVENDANAAAWGEYRFGAGEQEPDLVCLTVGTGIGGGIVLGGDLVRGAHGIAAELGHVLTVPNGHACGCGKFGCLEQYASGNALRRYIREAAIANPDRTKALLADVGGDPEKLTGPMVTEAAQAGDEVALEGFAQAGYWLAQGLADIVQILDPQILVVGGGVIDAGDLLLAPTRTAYIEALAARGRFPVAEIAAAKMGNTAGVVGAADLARRR
jgi:glucokinase